MMIDFDIENELLPDINIGEKLIWTGRPKKGIKLRMADSCLIPFSLAWGGFAIIWEGMAFWMGAPLIFKLFGIPFVIIGLYMMVGRFFVEARRRNNTVYGISRDRIIIKSGVFTRTVKSINIKSLNDITLKEEPDGSGTIYLAPLTSNNTAMMNVEWPGANIGSFPTLDMIEDAKMVYEQILQLQRG